MLTVLQTSIPDLPLVARGKVRDVYAIGDDKLLMIATDRISAFDCVLGSPIPGKRRDSDANFAVLVRFFCEI